MRCPVEETAKIREHGNAGEYEKAGSQSAVETAEGAGGHYQDVSVFDASWGASFGMPLEWLTLDGAL